MRILMVSKALVTGVYQQKLTELAKLPDIELLAVVPPSWRESRVGETRLQNTVGDGFELTVEPLRFNGNHHLHFYPGLARHIKSFKPDLVHIDEEPYNLVCAHTTWLARRHKAKTLFFTWQNLDRKYPPPFSLFERYCYRRASAALVGNAEAEKVLRRKGYKGEVDLIPQFGTDPAIFRPLPRRDGERPFTVGFYGRLVEEKGVDMLLDAIARMPASVHGLIVGNGDQLEALKARAEQLRISWRVEFRDPIPAEQIPLMLTEVDVVVVPSRTRTNWKEQFGRVIVEAHCCGLPVLGSDSGEIPNVVGDPAMIFPEGDVDALVAQLAALASDPARRQALGAAGRQRALNLYTQAQIAAQTYAVYKRVLAT